MSAISLRGSLATTNRGFSVSSSFGGASPMTISPSADAASACCWDCLLFFLGAIFFFEKKINFFFIRDVDNEVGLVLGKGSDEESGKIVFESLVS
jgi:cellulose synthase/poly-beta-1,6-N-acetylglucosamine synthase-like glycosyltransferase